MPENQKPWNPPASDAWYPTLILTSTFFIAGLLITVIAFPDDGPTFLGTDLTTILGTTIFIIIVLIGFMILRWDVTYQRKIRNHFNRWVKTRYNMCPASFSVFEKLQDGEAVYVDGQQIKLVEVKFDTFILLNSATQKELNIYT